MNLTAFNQLSPDYQALLQEAGRVRETAYCPYSGFHVGAALLSENGRIIAGSNVENAALGSSICAERSALVRANAEGQRRFQAIAITARSRDFDTTTVTAPCGSCRQMLFEAAQLAGQPLVVILADTNFEEIVVTDIETLLPMGFGPKDLEQSSD